MEAVGRRSFLRWMRDFFLNPEYGVVEYDNDSNIDKLTRNDPKVGEAIKASLEALDKEAEIINDNSNTFGPSIDMKETEEPERKIFGFITVVNGTTGAGRRLTNKLSGVQNIRPNENAPKARPREQGGRVRDREKKK